MWAIWNFKCWFPCLWSPLWGIQTTRSKPSLGTGWCALSWFNYLLLGTKRAKTRETRCAYSTTVQEVEDGRSIDWCKQVECMHARTRHAPATHGIDLFIFQLLPLSRWWATLSIITFVASDRCALKGHGIQTVHFQSGTIIWKVWRLGLSRTLSPREIHSVMVTKLLVQNGADQLICISRSTCPKCSTLLNSWWTKCMSHGLTV